VTDADPWPDDRAGSPVGPVVAVARSEVRSRWLSLLLIGLLAGAIGAVAIGGIALSRRTTTAYDRLGETTKVDDARGYVLRYPELVDELTELPVVTDSWVGGIGVAKVEGDNTFVGITAGPREPSPILDPIVLDGRLPQASSDPEVIEIVLREDFQREFNLPLGSTFPVQFLSEADYFRFDSLVRDGGEVHGPTAVLEVVGTVRMAGGFSTVPPAFASGDALESHPEAFIGTSFFLRLADGSADFPELETSIDDLAGDRTLPPEAEEFSVVDLSDTSIAEASVENTASLLGVALLIFALSTAVVGGVAVIQALARHHTATARDRDVEQALGMSRAQQTGARLLAGLLPAGIATALAAAGAIAAAGIEPIGAIDLYEPHPGAAMNVTVLLVGLAVVFTGVLAATALTGALQGRRRADTVVRESTVVNRVSRVGGSPPTVLGLRFALEAGRGTRAVPVRSAIAGATVGVAGVVAGLVFVSSLDRLIASPTRSAIPFDVGVADVTKEDFDAEIMDDPVVGDVSVTETAPIRVDGLALEGHAIEALRGSLDIGIEEGRLPRTPDEITLGLRAARDLDVSAGDTVTARQPGGEERELAVVGVAVVPTFNGEELGLNALLTPEGLAANGLAASFGGAAVEVAPGHGVDELTELLASRFEADSQAVPVAVQNLEQLGELPAGVAAIVGSIAVLALANALVVAVRRRRRDLAVLRSLGFTRRETATSVVVMSLAIVAIGVLVGLPVGLAVGATLWRMTASGAFVLSDAYFRWELLVLPVLGAVLIALVAASIPARQAAAQSPTEGLRAE
jgi:hypothetical protein